MNEITVYEILVRDTTDEYIKFIKDYLDLTSEYNARLASTVLYTYFPQYSVDFSNNNATVDTKYKYKEISNIDNIYNTSQLSHILYKTDNYKIFDQADNDYERLAIIVKAIVDIQLS